MSQPLRSPSSTPLFTKYPSILRRHVIVGDSPKVFIFPHLRKIQKAPSFAAFTEWKTVTVFFLPLSRYTPILRSMLHTHFAEILNSLLIYTVILLLQCVQEAFLPWFSHFRKHAFFRGFTVRIPVTSFITALLLRSRCRRPICKCEPYCLCKKSPHFINQQVITFQSFWDLISPHRKKALKCILLYFSKLKFHRMRRTFPVRLQRVSILFPWNFTRMLPDNVAKKPCRGIFIFCLLRKLWVFKQS